MLVHWIWLSMRPSVSDWARAALLRHFPDAEDIYFADGDAYRVVENLSEDAVLSLCNKDLHQAEEILRQCNRKNIHILTYRDAAYPCRLRNIADPPVVLYYKGRLPDFDGLPLIAAVGTRKASSYGMTIAKRMGYQISECGGVVVSGMAYGIDGMAMRGALSAGAPVVGVLGCGADVVYPASNASLYADVEQNGCLLTEFAPGTEPFKWNFPKRNRIISGLCCGVLVVEAPEKSGALITARQAAEQGRDVFVVPGNIDVASCAGSNALLRDGAVAVSSGWDILSEYAPLFPDKIHRGKSHAQQTAYPDEVKRAAEMEEKTQLKVAQKAKRPADRKAKNKKEIDNSGSTPYIDAKDKRPSLSENEELILSFVNSEETLVDEIMANVDLPAGAVLAALTMLEIKGCILRMPGKRVKRK